MPESISRRGDSIVPALTITSALGPALLQAAVALPLDAHAARALEQQPPGVGIGDHA